jgi:hyperosmotically inducible periplasmic protein
MHASIRKLVLATAIAIAFGAVSAAADAGSVKQEVTNARQETQIWTTYALSPHLRANDLQVQVEAGTATLTGVVEDDVNKELAREIAVGVSGIDKVVNQIEVRADFTPAAATKRGYGDVIDDASVTAAVKSKLLWSKHADGLSTTVTTTSGKVVLEGTAETAEAKALAGKLAANTRGVRAVDNRLKVEAPSIATQVDSKTDQAGTAIADSWITTKVKSTYMYSRNVSGSDISVATAEGVVTLSGKVDSGAERALAIELAQNIRGVRSVESKALVL